MVVGKNPPVDPPKKPAKTIEQRLSELEGRVTKLEKR